MADPPRYPETGADAGPGHDHGAVGSTPRWKFLVGIVVAIAVVVLIVLLHVTGTLGPGAH
jgi:hypothetical protein